MDKRFTVKIKEIIDVNPLVKTFVFDLKMKVKPGQFIMLALYGVGEKPFSVAEADFKTGYLQLTIKKFGNFTEELFKLKEGDLLSIRGPYGTSFTSKAGNVLLIGGGVGVPPLYHLAKTLKGKSKIYFVNAARSKDDIVLNDAVKGIADEVIIATDDGSEGFKGNAIQVAEKLIESEKIDFVYGAGPEIMLVKTVEMCKKYNVDYELSFERYMKCGIGICGQCACEPTGLVLCVEGPVLKPKQVEMITEFGQFKRIATGVRKYFNK